MAYRHVIPFVWRHIVRQSGHTIILAYLFGKRKKWWRRRLIFCWKFEYWDKKETKKRWKLTWISVQTILIGIVIDWIWTCPQKWDPEVTMSGKYDFLFGLNTHWWSSCRFHDTTRCTLIFIHRGSFTILCFPCMIHFQTTMELMSASLF